MQRTTDMQTAFENWWMPPTSPPSLYPLAPLSVVAKCVASGKETGEKEGQGATGEAD